MFGATFEAVDDHTGRWPDFGNSCVVTFTGHQITDDPVVKTNYQILLDHLDFIGMTTRVKASPDAQVIVNRSRDKETVPFLMLSEHGKGKVAYFAADIGQSYYTTPYQYERKLITNAIEWAAKDVSPVRVIAPMCVQATFYQQPFDGAQGDGKRTVVHLLNELNTTTDRALPEGNVSLREEIVPLADIRVLFRDASIRRVHLEPEAQDLPITRTDEGVQVTVPKLGLHSMVVAER